MVISLIVVIDLVLRFEILEAMYTDSGYFSRSLADEYYRFASGTEQFGYWSFHKISGAIEFQIALFLLTGLAACCMFVGLFTRLATIVVWLLVASMQARNPMINTSGDMLLKMLLFWSMFLPLGAYWSLDARRRGGAIVKQVTSFATAGVILQLLYMYLFTGFSKCNEVWFRGEALEYVMQLSIYTRESSQWVVQFPWLMKVASWLTVFGEIIFPLLLFLPFWNQATRWFNILSFWLLHLMISFTMAIGLFSYISMAGWLPLLPTRFWEMPLVVRVCRVLDLIFVSNKPAQRRQLRFLLWQGNLRLARKLVLLRAGTRWWANAVCCLAIVYFLWWNVSNIYGKLMPRPLMLVGASLNVDQIFHMFDIPPQHNPWFVYEAELANGEEVDIFRNLPVTHDRPDYARLTIPNHYWRKLHHNLCHPNFVKFREPLVLYAVRRWNAAHGPDEQVVYMKLTCYLDRLSPERSLNDQMTAVWGEFGTSSRRILKDMWKDIESGMPY
ncbi:MAG TPA: HTTM domain-containing protein [Pirellulaceae bacterium]|nr:HTTM domain-containing protein [Pirellulaceae bacterium]HMO90647.1 HTTM domain-containing protein [Pirellulaceae bacterium]HMP67774.1 HTTM domain-containing protein [Pirellulaceae bacterium]